VNVPCSTPALISAINTANSNGSGTIRLASFCTYVLTSAAATGRGPDGLPIISGNIRLIGGESTTIRRSASAPHFRIVEVAAGAALSLQRLYIAGGNADGTIPGNDTGGAILNSRGTIELIRTTVMDSIADSGAGISNASGRMNITRTILQGNRTRAGGGGGAGLYNDGTIWLTSVRFTGNAANTNGGGVYNGQGGRIHAIRLTLNRNFARIGGGGIYNAPDGSLALTHALIIRNTAGSGGGLFNAGITSRVAIFASLIAANNPNKCVPRNTCGLLELSSGRIPCSGSWS
jgi:hypothetical protein